jgi:hypothetical protein
MELDNTPDEILNEEPIAELHNDEPITHEEPIEGEPTPEPEFAPSYAYKAYGEEKEMDEWARGLITPDNQEHMTKLFSRAGGFDTLKDKYEKQKETYTGLESQFSESRSTLNGITDQRDRLIKAVEMGNYRDVFATLDISEEKILDYAEAKVRAMHDQSTPQFDQQYDQMTSQMNHDFERKQFEQQREQFSVQQHDLEVNTVFTRPDIAPLINEYNTRIGQPDAFRGLVEQVGFSELQRTGEHISVNDAVEKAKMMAGLGLTQSAPMMTEQPLETNKMELPKTKVAPIPNFEGSGNQAPIKQRPRSIEDIQKEYNELYRN